MKYLFIVLFLVGLIALTGCDAFKQGFNEGYSGGDTEVVE